MSHHPPRSMRALFMQLTHAAAGWSTCHPAGNLKGGQRCSRPAGEPCASGRLISLFRIPRIGAQHCMTSTRAELPDAMADVRSGKVGSLSLLSRRPSVRGNLLRLHLARSGPQPKSASTTIGSTPLRPTTLPVPAHFMSPWLGFPDARMAGYMGSCSSRRCSAATYTAVRLSTAPVAALSILLLPRHSAPVRTQPRSRNLRYARTGARSYYSFRSRRPS